ncbi:phosphoenolpyruvate carboxylase 2-like [Lathyrus oleraceus]|uniref:phosphoenolpyruvate carboxylase 2-like n=1 Tax=Pisum sativum TaxID=3888 RepID=UPI0021D199DD|nr:phosphoenolpyruvate carboxylase 2-like [Pisum sativum]
MKRSSDEYDKIEFLIAAKIMKTFGPSGFFCSKSIALMMFGHTQIQAAFRTDEIRRTPPTPQDEMRVGMSYFHETIWKGVPKFLRRVDTALKNIGVNECVPYNAPVIQFSSWMGGDRDGNPRVTPEVTRDVCLLARMMAANLYFSQIEDLMFELSMWRCNDELRVKVDELHRSSKRDAKHYISMYHYAPNNNMLRLQQSDGVHNDSEIDDIVMVM